MPEPVVAEPVAGAAPVQDPVQPAAPGVTPAAPPPAPPSVPAGTPPAGASPGGGPVEPVAETKFPQAALDRIKEETGKRQASDTRLQQVLAAHEAQEAKLRIYAGLEAKEKVDPNTQALRDDLEGVLPGIGKIVGMAERLEKMSEGYDGLQDSSDQQWRYFARGVQRLAHAEAAKHFGTLTPRTKEIINATFSRFINTEENRTRYYEGQHDELIDDFVNNWVLEGIVNPVRAHANAGTVTRVAGGRTVPQGGGQGVTATPTKPEEKPKNAREAANRMNAVMQATK